MTIDPRLHRIVAVRRGFPMHRDCSPPSAPINSIGVNSAHLYPDASGSPDSDFDLRGAHMLPIRRALAETKLPERPDYEAANRFLIKPRRETANQSNL